MAKYKREERYGGHEGEHGYQIHKHQGEGGWHVYSAHQLKVYGQDDIFSYAHPVSSHKTLKEAKQAADTHAYATLGHFALAGND